jgi:cyclic dehypoxanthinyl futalosine synthase
MLLQTNMIGFFMAKRISFKEGLDLFNNASLEELKVCAEEVRQEKNPGNNVTFVLDTNPNYTNVCNADCSFCAFYRKDSAKDAYTKTIDEVLQHMEFAREAGLTTVLLQGGLNDSLPLDYYVNLIKRCREEYPEINPHFFSAPEIFNIAKVEGISIKEVLQSLYNAGQRSLPGGGAEILSEDIRLKISPKKMGPDVWINVHKTAHQVGFKTTATMMYGHVETPMDILIHLDTLREAQDIKPGFTAFIPWSYKRDRTALRRSVKNWAGEDAYYRILAFSRIYLDNFDHIQASWFGEGKEYGIKSLHYGADDFGGTIIEENVHRATNFINKTDHRGIVEMIREAGYTPLQRNTFYEIVRTYDNEEDIFVPDAQKVREEDRTKILSGVA